MIQNFIVPYDREYHNPIEFFQKQFSQIYLLLKVPEWHCLAVALSGSMNVYSRNLKKFILRYL